MADGDLAQHAHDGKDEQAGQRIADQDGGPDGGAAGDEQPAPRGLLLRVGDRDNNRRPPMYPFWGLNRSNLSRNSHPAGLMPNPPPPSRLASWFTQWSEPLKRWLASRRRVPPADLEDVTQEVFLRLLKYRRADVIDAPQAYLFQVAGNVANEWALRARSRHPHESRWLNELTIEDVVAADIVREQTRNHVSRALLELPPRAREILRLRYRDGLSNAEIAARLKVHPQTVKRDLLQAYSRLRLDLRLNEVVGLARSKEGL